ncbi:MAG: putative toxin-antitoxin system toxin component, PIN family [Rhizobacter sp.]|nr:putative toxin-antitoxin system toxin component, PIN family [Rhizobacter sp.]
MLDTQVVLDWLVFRDPTTLALGCAIERGSLRWLASQPMLGEIEQVLDRGVGAARLPDRAAIREVCARLAHPAEVAAASALRCTDPDDQMFIDLALAARARWLFTRDKALLRLATRARAGGVWVLRPADWQQPPDHRDVAPGGAHPGTKRPPEGGP